MFLVFSSVPLPPHPLEEVAEGSLKFRVLAVTLQTNLVLMKTRWKNMEIGIAKNYSFYTISLNLRKVLTNTSQML